MTGRTVEQVLADNLRAEAAEMRPAGGVDRILVPGRERECVRELALENFSDPELKEIGRRAVERITSKAGAEGATSTPESPTTLRSRGT